MAAVRRDDEFRRRRELQFAEFGDGDDRIVFGGQDRGGDLQRRQRIAGDRIAVQVIFERTEIGVAQHHVACQFAHAAAQLLRREQLRLREQFLFSAQRLAPFGHEVMFVEPWRVFDRTQSRVRADHRTHRERPRQRNTGRRCAKRNAQREIAAERKAADDERARRECRGDLLHGADDFVDAARMEQPLIQMMRVAVIAEVEPQHVAAIVEQAAGGVEDVARLRAAFPAVQQDRERARVRGDVLARVETLQPHAVAAIEHVFDRALLDVGLALAQQRSAAPPTRESTARADCAAGRADEYASLIRPASAIASAMRRARGFGGVAAAFFAERTGSRKYTVASIDGPPSRRRKFDRKFSFGANGTLRSIVLPWP